MPQKTCSKCKKTKDVSEFHKRNSKSHLYQSWCKECKKGHDNLRYETKPLDKERIRRNSQRTIETNQGKLWEILIVSSCVDCGNSDPRVLEFDHIDETTKLADVTSMFGLSWARIEAEIAKCVVRCANCHRIRTQEQFGTWRHLRTRTI